MSGIRVLLVHDYELARRGLRRMLEGYEDIEVVGEAGNAVEAIGQVGTVSPDVVLMDAEMPHVSGLETIRILKEQGYSGAVIVLSIDIQQLDDALRLGVGGYLVQDAQADELVSAIRRVPEGGFVFGATLMKTAQGQEKALRYLLGPEVGTGSMSGNAAGLSGEGRSEGHQAVEEKAVAEQPPGEPAKDTTEPTQWVTGPANTSPTPSPDMVVSDVELMISPPVEPGMVLKLHQWLTGVANVDVGEITGSWTGDTLMRASVRRPLPLLKMLGELPDVVKVTEEPYAMEGSGPSPGVLRSPGELLGMIDRRRTLTKRFRLVFKGQVVRVLSPAHSLFHCKLNALSALWPRAVTQVSA